MSSVKKCRKRVIVLFITLLALMPFSLQAYAASWSSVSGSDYNGSFLGAPDGSVWAVEGDEYDNCNCTKYQIVRYTKSGSSWSKSDKTTAEQIFQYITIGNDGTVWRMAGTKIYKYTGSAFAQVKDFETGSGSEMVTGPDGIWISFGGIYYETQDSGTTWVERGTDDGYLLIGPDRKVWKGLTDGKLYRWDGSWTYVTQNTTGLATKYNSSYYTAGNGIWHHYYDNSSLFNSDHDYFAYWDGTSWSDKGASPISGFSYHVNDVAVAPDGSICFSYNGNWATGVHRWDGTQWVSIGNGDEDCDDMFTVDGANGYLWTGSGDEGAQIYGEISYPNATNASNIGDKSFAVNVGSSIINCLVEVYKDGIFVKRVGGSGPAIMVDGLEPNTQYQAKVGNYDSVTGRFQGSALFNVKTLESVTKWTLDEAASGNAGIGDIVTAGKYGSTDLEWYYMGKGYLIMTSNCFSTINIQKRLDDNYNGWASAELNAWLNSSNDSIRDYSSDTNSFFLKTFSETDRDLISSITIPTLEDYYVLADLSNGEGVYGNTWWLKSPYLADATTFNKVYVVHSDGYITSKNVTETAAVRPAFRLKAEIGGGSGSASAKNTFSVVQNKPFQVVVVGQEFEGDGTVVSGETTYTVVKATKYSGYTIIENHPDYNKINGVASGFSSTGVKVVTVGGKKFYFTVVPTPTPDTIGTVTFGS